MYRTVLSKLYCTVIQLVFLYIEAVDKKTNDTIQLYDAGCDRWGKRMISHYVKSKNKYQMNASIQDDKE